MREWLSTSVCIFGCSGPQCDDHDPAFLINRLSDFLIFFLFGADNSGTVIQRGLDCGGGKKVTVVKKRGKKKRNSKEIKFLFRKADTEEKEDFPPPLPLS